MQRFPGSIQTSHKRNQKVLNMTKSSGDHQPDLKVLEETNLELEKGCRPHTFLIPCRMQLYGGVFLWWKGLRLE